MMESNAPPSFHALVRANVLQMPAQLVNHSIELGRPFGYVPAEILKYTFTSHTNLLSGCFLVLS